MSHPPSTTSSRRRVLEVVLISFVWFVLLIGTSYYSWNKRRRQQRYHEGRPDDELQEMNTTPTSSSTIQHSRTGDTDYDRYYAKHQKLQDPRIMHATLSSDPDTTTTSTTNNSRRVLIVGDIHGCLDELKLLLDKATVMSDDGDGNEAVQPFHSIVLVGDLINKGPYSKEVLDHVRRQQQQQQQQQHRTTGSVPMTQWHVVRGNHEVMSLEVALEHGSTQRKKKKKIKKKKIKKKFAWMYDSHGNSVLSDDDIAWMSELPYTITIPASFWGEFSPSTISDYISDYTVVHGGFLPHLSIHQQSSDTMVTIRTVQRVDKEHYEALPKHNPGPSWAREWKHTPHVVFGHDAHRGLQQHEYATGIDTGAVYGRKLTGLILPERTLVSVDSLRKYAS